MGKGKNVFKWIKNHVTFGKVDRYVEGCPRDKEPLSLKPKKMLDDVLIKFKFKF